MGTEANGAAGGLLDHQRFQTLTDGVFAIVMTIMVLNLKVPETAGSAEVGLGSALVMMVSQLVDYAVSFLLLAMLWIVNNQNHAGVRQSGRIHVWLGMIFLLFVSLVPFTTSLMDRFSGKALSEVCFHLNLLLVGIFAYAQWHYVMKQGLIPAEDMEKGYLARRRALNLALPAVALLALIITPIAYGYSSLTYLLIPLAKSRLKIRRAKDVSS